MFRGVNHYNLVSLCLILSLLAACGGNAPQETQSSVASGENVFQETQDSAANGETELRLVITTNKVSVEQTSDVEIHLDDVVNLYGLHVCLKFDPTKLQVQDADPEQDGVQIMPGHLPVPDFTALNLVDNEQGTIDYAVVQLNPRQPTTGSGVVAVIHFQGIGAGVSPLTFLRAEMADRDGNDLPVYIRDAEFEVN